MLFIDYPDEEKLQDILSATETGQGFRNLVTLFTMMKEYKERKKYEYIHFYFYISSSSTT